MKSERKHTLESNLLADKIEQLAINLKKAMPAILAVTAVVLVGLLSYGFYTSVKEKESAKGWTALYFADTEAADLQRFQAILAGLRLLFGQNKPLATQTCHELSKKSTLIEIWQSNSTKRLLQSIA